MSAALPLSPVMQYTGLHHHLKNGQSDMRSHSLLLVPGVALAAVMTLAGCSNGHGGPDSPTPTAKSTPSAVALESNRCVDDHLTVTDVRAAKKAMAAGCATISFLTDDADVEIGPVDVLNIEGSDNTVHGSSMKTVHAMGTGNRITYVGDAPNTDEIGDGNSAEAAKE